MPLTTPTRRTYPELATAAALLVGLLHHGTQQHDALVMLAIFKDAMERAGKLHDELLRRKL